MTRRRRQTGGFVMAEALVALAIAAMTIALLTSASWGLRMASDRREAAAQTGAADWLAARRALSGWAAGITASDRTNTAGQIIGTATNARMFVATQGSATYVGELRVEAVSDTTYALIAARHLGLADARIADDTPQESEIVRASEPIRLLYLLPREAGAIGLAWRYETGNGADGLPAAIAVEVGDRRILTARIFATASASCLADLGRGGLETDDCALR